MLAVVGATAAIYAYSMAPGGADASFMLARVLMGTSVEITVAGMAPARAEPLIAKAFESMERIDREMSRSNPSGALGRLNRDGRAAEAGLAEGLGEVLRLATAIARDSGGAFDPTIGSVSRLWDFDGGGVVPDAADLAAEMQKVGWTNFSEHMDGGKVEFDTGGSEIDLGAIAKGYAIDRAVSILVAGGVTSGMVDAGGDLRLIGGRPGGGAWRIGVQHPRETGGLAAKLGLRDLAVVTSGDYERSFTVDGVTYHHILDPATGMPARSSSSVTVVATTAAEADACATAAFVLGPERGIEFLRSRPGVHGLIIDSSGGMHWSDSWIRQALL